MPDNKLPYHLWLQEAVRKSKLSQAEVTRRSGISESNFWRIYHGKPARAGGPIQTPNYATAEAIGRAVGDVPGSLFAAGFGNSLPEGYVLVSADSENEAENVTFVKESSRIYPSGRDKLYLFGQELNSMPFRYALAHVGTAGAGLERRSDSGVVKDLDPGALVRAIQIAGDCMAPLLNDGDIALILPAEHARDGKAVLALIDGGVTVCKRIRIVERESWLENGNGERIPEDRFIIIGTVAHKIITI